MSADLTVIDERDDVEKSLNILVKQLDSLVTMDLWMFTTVIDNDWIIIAASENPYGVSAGDVLPWNDSVCSRMVETNGPNLVPVLENNELYVGAPIVKQLPISAYIGFPIKNENQEVLGTLCAIDQQKKESSLEKYSEQIESLLHIAQTLLIQKDTIKRLYRALEFLDAQSDVDDITGLPNQDAFFDIAEQHKSNCDKLGCPLGLVIIDIGGLTLKQNRDELSYHDLLRAISTDLNKLARDTDVVAKLDGNKFGMLLLNVEHRFVSAMVVKISNILSPYKLKVSIGADMCRERDSISQSIENANANKLL